MKTKIEAEMAVAERLRSLGFDVAFTKGAHPADLIVTSPKGRVSWLDVKGTRPKPDGSKSIWWCLSPKTYRIGSTPLFYVFVYIDQGYKFQVMPKRRAERRVRGTNPPCLYGWWTDAIDQWRLLP